MGVTIPNITMTVPGDNTTISSCSWTRVDLAGMNGVNQVTPIPLTLAGVNGADPIGLAVNAFDVRVPAGRYQIAVQINVGGNGIGRKNLLMELWADGALLAQAHAPCYLRGLQGHDHAGGMVTFAEEFGAATDLQFRVMREAGGSNSQVDVDSGWIVFHRAEEVQVFVLGEA